MAADNTHAAPARFLVWQEQNCFLGERKMVSAISTTDAVSGSTGSSSSQIASLQKQIAALEKQLAKLQKSGSADAEKQAQLIEQKIQQLEAQLVQLESSQAENSASKGPAGSKTADTVRPAKSSASSATLGAQVDVYS